MGATTGFPGSYPYYLALDFGSSSVEVVRVTAGVGLNLTVTRGVSGTTAVAHGAGVAVVHVAPSEHYNEVEKFLPINSGSAGLVTHTAADTFVNRSLASGSANGLVVSNANGAAGNPTLTLQAKLEAIASSSATGFWAHTGGSAVQNRTITAGSNITVTNGDGVSGNPTIAIASSAWTAFTPTWTNVTVGDGVSDCSYIQHGKLVVARFKFTLGSTSAITGTIQPSLPVTATAGASLTVGSMAVFRDVSAPANFIGLFHIATTTQAQFTLLNRAGANDQAVGTSSTTPFTWANGDVVGGSLVYEAA